MHPPQVPCSLLRASFFFHRLHHIWLLIRGAGGLHRLSQRQSRVGRAIFLQMHDPGIGHLVYPHQNLSYSYPLTRMGGGAAANRRARSLWGGGCFIPTSLRKSITSSDSLFTLIGCRYCTIFRMTLGVRRTCRRSRVPSNTFVGSRGKSNMVAAIANSSRIVFILYWVIQKDGRGCPRAKTRARGYSPYPTRLPDCKMHLVRQDSSELHFRGAHTG